MRRAALARMVVAGSSSQAVTKPDQAAGELVSKAERSIFGVFHQVKNPALAGPVKAKSLAPQPIERIDGHKVRLLLADSHSKAHPVDAIKQALPRCKFCAEDPNGLTTLFVGRATTRGNRKRLEVAAENSPPDRVPFSRPRSRD